MREPAHVVRPFDSETAVCIGSPSAVGLSVLIAACPHEISFLSPDSGDRLQATGCGPLGLKA
jgi:hypothetical protein